jgi:octaprenyl-diphosphate synthase
VVDESGMRRSRQTANAIFGNAASVLVGDFLYSRAFQMMVSINSLPVMAVLSEATNVIAEGEVLQLMNCQDPDVDEARYLQVIRFKTAKLFEASASLPAVLSGEAAALVEAFAAYGRHIGTAFQLTDDILDYSGDETEMGKQLGDDLREGKPTLPLIRLLSNGSASDQALIRTAIVQPESADIEAVIGRVRASDALAYAKGVAEQECRRAREALAPLADSEAKTSLLDLASFVLERQG